MTAFQHGEITVNEDGDRIVELDIWSNLLPHLSIDTYSTFTGDGWLESELEHFGSGDSDAPYDSDQYDDYEWSYDHPAILKVLAEASAGDVLDQLAGQGILLMVEVKDTSSPSEYNFTTDSYSAIWTVNLTKLEAWAAENGFEAQAYATEHHGSYDGFMSFVDRWLEDEPEDTKLWLMLDAYFRAELDSDSQFNAVCEVEWEAYSDHTTITRIGQDTEA